MQLSRDFSLNEFVKSDLAIRKGINNTPSMEVVDKLKKVAVNVLQKVRDKFNRPVRVNSGYRSYELNVEIRGSSSSQHTKGEAADFEIDGMDNKVLAEWVRDNVDFDQLILEFYDKEEGPNSGWVHCSYKEKGNRKSILTAKKVDGKTTYAAGLI